MLGKSLASPLLTFDSTAHFCNYPDYAAVTTTKLNLNVNLSVYAPWNALQGGRQITSTSKNWELQSTAQIQDVILSDEDKKKWESCRQALSAYGFASEEEDKILGKAFGHIHSPYWGEERKKEVPKFEVVTEVLSYLKDLGLTDEDLGKILKKFPEVLGCSLENELKANVQILEKAWGIKAWHSRGRCLCCQMSPEVRNGMSRSSSCKHDGIHSFLMTCCIFLRMHCCNLSFKSLQD